MNFMAKGKTRAKNLKSSIDTRHIGVLLEHMDDKLSLVAEQHGDIKKDIGEIRQTLTAHTEMIGNLTVEVSVIKEDIGVMKGDIETTKSDIKVMKGDISTTKNDVEIIKTDIEFIKGGLKKKVDVEEFSALERRVILLEKRHR